jgi:hypothetical protein
MLNQCRSYIKIKFLYWFSRSYWTYSKSLSRGCRDNGALETAIDQSSVSTRITIACGDRAPVLSNWLGIVETGTSGSRCRLTHL